MSKKLKIVEGFSVSLGETGAEKNTQLKEKDLSIELKENEKGTAISVYTFPISRPDVMNLNGRIYSGDLWREVIERGDGIGDFGLMNHPHLEGDTKDTWCVWKNLRFSDDGSLILCDAYLFGKWGKHVEDALNAGGRIGLSTSGYGYIDDDGVVSDYVLERVADHVLTPSAQVYGVKDDKIENPVESVSESTETPAGDSKDEEASLRLNIANMLKEIEIIESEVEKVREYKTLKDQLELSGMLEDVRLDLIGKIEEIENSIKTSSTDGEELLKLLTNLEVMTAENDKLVSDINTIEEENTKISEKYTSACKLLDEMKDYCKELEDDNDKVIAEKNGRLTADEGLSLRLSLQDSVSKVATLETELGEKELELTTFRNNFTSNEVVEALKAKIVMLEDSLNKSKEKLEITRNISVDEAKAYVNKKRVVKEVRAYYYDLVKTDNKVVEMRDSILACQTLEDAQKFYIENKGGDDTVKVVSTDDSIDEVISDKRTYIDNWDVKKIKGWI